MPIIPVPAPRRIRGSWLLAAFCNRQVAQLAREIVPEGVQETETSRRCALGGRPYFMKLPSYRSAQAGETRWRAQGPALEQVRKQHEDIGAVVSTMARRIATHAGQSQKRGGGSVEMQADSSMPQPESCSEMKIQHYTCFAS